MWDFTNGICKRVPITDELKAKLLKDCKGDI